MGDGCGPAHSCMCACCGGTTHRKHSDRVCRRSWQQVSRSVIARHPQTPLSMYACATHMLTPHHAALSVCPIAVGVFVSSLCPMPLMIFKSFRAQVLSSATSSPSSSRVRVYSSHHYRTWRLGARLPVVTHALVLLHTVTHTVGPLVGSEVR